MNIAIFGYKIFGRHTSENLLKYWGGRYKVTRIYDPSLAGEKDPFWDIVVSDPAHLRSDHESGAFEKILVCVLGNESRMRLNSDLEEMGIPTLITGDPADFVCPEKFGAETVMEMPEGRIYRIRNAMAARAENRHLECMYVFNSEGRILNDTWVEDEWFASEIKLSYPFRLKEPLTEKIPLAGSYCFLTKIYGCNYWHFTFQSLCDVYMLEKSGFTGKYIINDEPYNREAMLMMGVSPERMVSIETFQLQKCYVVEEVYGVQTDQRSAVRDKLIMTGVSRKIRSRLKRDAAYPRYIYVKRIGSRKLTNGDELAEKYGFVTIIPEELSVREQMEYFYNADIVLCPHGANSTNCLYMHENSVFIEIFSDRWYNDVNSGACRVNHVHHLKAVGNADGIKTTGPDDDYTVPENVIRPVILKAYELADDPSRDFVWSDDTGEIFRGSEGILIYGAQILGDRAYNTLSIIAGNKMLGFAVTDISGNPEEKQGYPVHAVQEWRQILDDRSIPPDHVAVVMALNPGYYAEVNELLKQYGFKHIFELEDMEQYYQGQFREEKKYRTGLLMGVFDLFHIGHLNLIRRAKERCSYLRVGVLSDELTHEFKNRYPVIPQNERMQILAALKDVDEVVLLEKKDDVYRPNEWKKRPFDCFFSGDDYADNEDWKREKAELQKLGADMEFFGYTKERSSTMIREEIKKRESGR